MQLARSACADKTVHRLSASEQLGHPKSQPALAITYYVGCRLRTRFAEFFEEKNRYLHRFRGKADIIMRERHFRFSPMLTKNNGY
jgi:hypothetical protein